jgi:glutamine synthetase
MQVSGTNAEVMPGQWEYQVGPCEGIESGDQLWVSRYIMQRVCEKYGVVVSFAPKPITRGDWNGAGCHTNFSTKDMRDPACTYEYTGTFGPYAGKTLRGGFAKIIEGVERLVSWTLRVLAAALCAHVRVLLQGAPGKPSEHINLYGPSNQIRLTGKHETARWDQFSYGVANRGQYHAFVCAVLDGCD